MKVSLIDASHFDANEAFAAINTFRLDDLQPHIYRPTDGGRTWTHITNGIPDGGIINTVREDPKRRGLLFAGSEQAVCVSFDSGGRWQSLRLNMPATSIRDLVIKDDDLIAGTHGRSFWILDDITAAAAARYTALGRATAVRAAGCDARALEHEHGYAAAAGRARRPEPARRRPPALLAGRGCAIRDARDRRRRRDGRAAILERRSPEPLVEGRNTPDYWIRPNQPLRKTRGLHRFVWDLHHERPAVGAFSYPIAAIWRNTPRTPLGSWVLPGLAAHGRWPNGLTDRPDGPARQGS